MESVTFTNGLWAESIRVMRLNAKNSALYVCAMLAIAVLPELFTKDGEVSGLWIAQSIAAALMAIPAHLTALRNSPILDASAKNATMGFVWRGIGIGAMSAIPSFIIFVGMLIQDVPVVVAVLVAGPIWLILASASFARWGTILPAIITDHAWSFSAAAQRGMRTFRYAFPRLLVSFGLISAVQLIILFGIAMFSNGDGNFFPKAGGVDLYLIIALVISSYIGAFSLVMTAVILSRSFLMAEGKTALE